MNSILFSNELSLVLKNGLFTIMSFRNSHVLSSKKGVVFFELLPWNQKLLRLGWEVMLHLPYSPDPAPSKYYLFRSLQNSLNGKTFNDDEAVKSYLVPFFANKN